MSSSVTVSERLPFLSIDSTARAALKEFYPILEKGLPNILEELYGNFRNLPQLAKLFRDEKAIARGRDGQYRHWLLLFSLRFDDEYEKSVPCLSG